MERTRDERASLASCVGRAAKAQRSVIYDCTEGAGEGSQWWSTERSEVRNHWNRVARGWNPERVAEMHDAIETSELMVQSLSLFQSSRFALSRSRGSHSLPLMLHPWLPSNGTFGARNNESLFFEIGASISGQFKTLRRLYTVATFD